VVAPGGSVRLTATASDEDGDPLTYAWSATWGGFDGPVDATAATWTAAPEPGRATIRIRVSDGRGGSAEAQAEVEAVNGRPEFEQSYRFELPENVDGRKSPVVLGAVAGEDPDGDALTYSLAAGDRERFAVGVRDGTVLYVGAGEDFETEPNRYELTVRVRDPFGAGDEARVAVEVTDVNELPEVTASCDPCAVPRGGEVRLAAAATDPDGDPLAYAWSAERGGFTGPSDRPVAVWKARTNSGRWRSGSRSPTGAAAPRRPRSRSKPSTAVRSSSGRPTASSCPRTWTAGKPRPISAGWWPWTPTATH